MGAEKTLHAGKTILVADYRGAQRLADQLALLEDLAAHVETSPERTLILQNFDGVFVSTEFVNRASALGDKYRARIARMAILGADGLKRLLVQSYIAVSGNRDVRTFEREAEALEWLVE